MEFEERYFRGRTRLPAPAQQAAGNGKTPSCPLPWPKKMRIRILNALLEGVAFLTGNLRQKIEDEFPELTHGLIKMLWPNYPASGSGNDPY